MNSAHRYYIPKISEFHPGLEFEYRPRKNFISHSDHEKYEPEYRLACFGEEFFPANHQRLAERHLTNTFPLPLSDIPSYIKDGMIRVKYLDRMDFQRLHLNVNNPFKLMELSEHSLCIDAKVMHARGEYELTGVYVLQSNQLVLSLDKSTVFAGICLNYTEFVEILDRVRVKSIVWEKEEEKSETNIPWYNPEDLEAFQKWKGNK